MVSVIIPFRNEFEEIGDVLFNLLTSCELCDIEIIVVNDGSTQNSGKFRPLTLSFPDVKVINITKPMGVGFAFDRGVESATGEIVVLMGCDVFPVRGWYEKVIKSTAKNPFSIGCAVCIGNAPPFTKHYGADLLFTVGADDLPQGSKLRDRRGGYTDLFKGKWRDKEGDEQYDLPCLMGAFYFTTKSYYKKIHGWDTEPGNYFIGHRVWSHLEPYISLKSWLYGGGCYLEPGIEAKHIFGRLDRRNKWSKGARSAEWFHWNSIFMLETMILNEFQRNRLYDFKTPELNWNVAQHYIRKHYANVERIKQRNRQEFKNDLSIFTDRFGYKFNS